MDFCPDAGPVEGRRLRNRICAVFRKRKRMLTGFSFGKHGSVVY